MEEAYIPFAQRVNDSIESSDFTKVVQYFIENTNNCAKDASAVQRLLNNLNRLNLTESINDCFQALIRIGFVFDSIEYVQPLNSLIEVNKTVT